MDPLTLTTITGVASAAKASIETVLAILSKGKGREAEKATKDALALVSDLQSRLFELQEIAFRLHREKAEALEENANLRTEIRRKEEGAAERQKYQLKKIGRSTVLVREDQPEHHYCPTCFETKKQAIPLQPHPHPMPMFGSHFCRQCNTTFRLRG